jgi:hypothetical protein
MCIQNILTTIQEQAGFGTFGNTLIAILYVCQLGMAMVSPAIIGKIGVVKAIVLSSVLMSSFSFSLVIVGWRGTLTPEETAAEHGGVWKFFDSKMTA